MENVFEWLQTIFNIQKKAVIKDYEPLPTYIT